MSASVPTAAPEIRHFHELRFTVLATDYEHYVEFIVYDIQSYQDDDQSKPHWPRQGADTSPDSVDNLGEAEIYLHGSIKWDGCSNWYFDEQDRNMLHGCSRQEIQRFGDVMGACWDWAAELMPGLND